jgi:hypothetical protein
MSAATCRGCGLPAPSPPARRGCSKCARLSLDLCPTGTLHPALRVTSDTPSRLVIELDGKAESDPSWFFPLMGLPLLFWLPFALLREGPAAALPPLVLVCACVAFAVTLYAHRKRHKTTLELSGGVLKSTSLSIFTRTASIPLSEVQDLASHWYMATKAGKGAQLAATRAGGWPVVLWFNVKEAAIVACAERMLRERLRMPV